MGKDEIIASIYYDPSGYGSILNTAKEAKQKDKTITLEDVKKWFNKNVEQKTNHSGQNSYVASKPYEEFQMDLFFINDLENQKMKVGMLIIDIFTKYLVVIPLNTKDEGDVASGLMEGFNKMGGTPDMLYTDNETSLKSNSIKKYFVEKNIRHIATRGKAAVAEITIRTFKNMLYKRIGNDKTQQWTDFIYSITLTYNNKNVHSSTKMTPKDARKASNRIDVKNNLEMRAKTGRKYQEVSVGDFVKIFKKKKVGVKQQISYWSTTKHEILSIEVAHGQKFYTVEGTRPLLRHEMLKVEE
jgi:hypothetical protein